MDLLPDILKAGFERTGSKCERGFTLIEMLVALLMLLIAMRTIAPNLLALNKPLDANVASTIGFLQNVRGRAMAATRAYTVTAASTGRLTTTFGRTCTATQTNDPSLTLNLAKGAVLTSTGWSICFTSRGVASAVTTISLRDSKSNVTKQLQVYLGGGVKVLP